MAVAAQTIVDAVEVILQDPSNIRWSADELLNYLNEGQRTVVLFKPDANSVYTTHTLVSGDRQTIPSDGIRLLDVLRNVNADSAKEKSISQVGRSELDTVHALWHTSVSGSAPTDVIQHYVYDPMDPQNFYVYPAAASGTQQVILTYAAVPTEITALTSNITLPDVYQAALTDYVCYRAYGKDSESASNNALKEQYWGQFMRVLNTQVTVEANTQPMPLPR
jgi:hypothetical protein